MYFKKMITKENKMKIFILLIILLFLIGCSGAGIENKYGTKGDIYRYKGPGTINKFKLTIITPPDPNTISLINDNEEKE